MRITITIDVSGPDAAPVVSVGSTGASLVPAPLGSVAPPRRAIDLEPEHPFKPDASIAGEGPRPPTPEVNATAEAERQRQARLTRGYETFAGLLNLWRQGFGFEGAEQPDRVKALNDILSGGLSGPMHAYVKGCGGLRAAIRAVLPPRDHHLVDPLAENIAQVTSAIQWSEIADLLEPVPRNPLTIHE